MVLRKLLPKRLTDGFTLIELMVVITIIGILSTVSLTVYRDASKSARISRRAQDLKNISTSLEVYKTANGAYPISTTMGCIDTALATLVPNYLTSLPNDPSGSSYCYQYISPDGKNYKLRTNPALADMTAADYSKQPGLIDPATTNTWAVYSLKGGQLSVPPTPTPTSAPTQAPAPTTPPPATNSIYWGGIIEGTGWSTAGTAPYNTTAWNQFETDAGKKVSILDFGVAWHYGNGFVPLFTGDLDTVRLRGAIPQISWYSGPRADDPSTQLTKIIQGNFYGKLNDGTGCDIRVTPTGCTTFDQYLTTYAQTAAAYKHPFFIRFDGEMNGNWWSYSDSRNGNTAGQFATMWKHVVDIFKANGATNVTWVWCPNVDNQASPSWGVPFSQAYPGASYVDWVCLDGYSNGTYAGGWQTFAQIFGTNYNNFATLAPNKPIMIAETGATEVGGSKPAWLTDTLTNAVPNLYPNIKAFDIYNVQDSASLTWQIESSANSITAYKNGIASSYYMPGSATLLALLPDLQPIQPLTPVGFVATTTTTTTTPATNSVKVNTGGGAYTDSKGNSWSADNSFTGGSTYSVTNTILNTSDQTLYQSQRFGNFSYNIPVASGNYTVTLKFAEPYWTTAGQRVFNVSINGTQVLTNFDILSQVAPFTALDKTFNVTAGNGNINIVFTTVTDNAEINAIQVVPTPTTTPSPSAGACQTPQVATNLLPSGSVPAGNVTLNWSPVAGITNYQIRVDDLSNGFDYNCVNNNPGDICNNNVATNSYSVTLQAGHSYNWLVLAVNSCGGYSQTQWVPITPTSASSDTQAPSVSITNPSNGTTVTRGTNITLKASASDNIAVSKVQFYLNNSLICTSLTSPYNCNLQVPNKPGVSYTITATAYDTSNNQSSASVGIRVQ